MKKSKIAKHNNEMISSAISSNLEKFSPIAAAISAQKAEFVERLNEISTGSPNSNDGLKQSLYFVGRLNALAAQYREDQSK